MTPSPIRSHFSLPIFVFFLAVLTLAACEMRLQIPATSEIPNIPKYEFETTGEDYLVSAIEEIHAIADWAESFTNGPNRSVSNDASVEQKSTLAKTSTDTAYIYGQIIAGGYGAVVTERYAYPKGLLLITIRKTYGKEDGHIVTETKRYASHADFRNDNPQQTNVTELFGRQKDTIVTYVLRNGRLDTYTFRLPVLTKAVNSQDGSVRVTTRYASSGAIVSKVEDGAGNLIQIRRSYGQTDGSTVTRTEFPDRSWKQVRTVGQVDGTILRETTSGFLSLGSGNAAPIGRPPILRCVPQGTHGEAARTITEEEASLAHTFASGCAVKPPKLPPTLTPQRRMPGETTRESLSERELRSRSLASGCVARPPKILPPPPNQRMLGEASLVVTPDKKPPLRSLASGCPLKPAKPPIFQPPNQHMLGEATCGTTYEKKQLDRSLASGGTVNKLPHLPPPNQLMLGKATNDAAVDKGPLSRSFASGCTATKLPKIPPPSAIVCMNLQMHQQ